MNSGKEGNNQEVENLMESTEVEKIAGAEEFEQVEEGEGIREKNSENEAGNAGEKEEEEEEGLKIEKTNGTGELLSPRPTRERKMVARFTLDVTLKSSTPKVAIEKGRGTQLKDIPNVAFKLSRRKTDENLHLLHTILFGKKAKVHTLKKNIGMFSGFVWVENEEKQRAKMKEKIDKCVKEKLLDFCDVLNIPVSKATVKKEELSVKLLEFLESPYATTDILLADKEKGKKRKSNDSSNKASGSSNVAGGKHTKKPRLDSESEKKRKHSTEDEPSQSEDDTKFSGEETEEEGHESEKETDEEDHTKVEIVIKTSSPKKTTKKDTNKSIEKFDKKVPAKGLNASGKFTKDSSSSASKKGAGESESKSKKKELSTKKEKTEKDNKMDTSPPAKIKGSNQSSPVGLKTDQGEGKTLKKAEKEPSGEEMQAVIVKILKEVDFNTATLSDILRKLGEHFGIDMIHRKAEVKDIITEVIKNMSDDEEASESEDESGKDDDA